jgi:hypothetical protein
MNERLKERTKKSVRGFTPPSAQRPNPENSTTLEPWMTHFQILNNVLLHKYTTLGRPSGIAFLHPIPNCGVRNTRRNYYGREVLNDVYMWFPLVRT